MEAHDTTSFLPTVLTIRRAFNLWSETQCKLVTYYILEAYDTTSILSSVRNPARAGNQLYPGCLQYDEHPTFGQKPSTHELVTDYILELTI
jgi:hypothetical protein